ncbi:uncharacterized protein LOC106050624 isoform X2 [Biomphalaria glabrata]|uniref:Uncharacterized protein LOC106050624 isoform X2 n=1 Tax=Biomphalaria glabrata TaxID=6526 RepID=A0A9W2ZDX9_BIOGL|nr:uncharacterized protein LOC106050624 isoform X2 [Biomphalaria glabrata]
MIIILLIHYIFVLTISWHVIAVSLSMGKEYLISTPAIVSSSGAKQVSSITMYLVTYVPPIQLSFLVHWTPQSKNKKIPNYVIASKVYTIVVDPIYCYNKLPGIRWTFHLIGSNYFGLVVSLMEHGAPHMETFVPLPVAGWGKEYFAVTMGYRYSIIIIANDGPNQIFFTINAAKRDFRMKFDKTHFEDGEIWSIELKKFQSYAVTNCAEDTFVGSLTGSYLRGTHAFGVVTGNCLSQTDDEACGVNQNEPDDISFNLLAEMLLPRESFGKTFILFRHPRPETKGHYIIVAGSDNTFVKLYNETLGTFGTLKLQGVGSWHKTEATSCYMTSNKGIQVTYVLASSCKGMPNDAPSLCNLIPVELFYFKYLCSVPKNQEMFHYILYTVELKAGKDIRLDFAANTSSFSQQYVRGNNAWRTYSATVLPGSSFVIYSTQSTFGCYLFGWSARATYMHPAGFISSPINLVCIKSIKKMRPLDLIDNDCDGKIDEEINNQIDDDGDELIDEDLNIFTDNNTVRTMSLVDFLSATPNLPETTMTPKWSQMTTIPQSVNSSRPSGNSSISSRICTTPYHYGENCRYSCKHCLSDCDKVNGSCDDCYPGYEDPELACTTVQGKYGDWSQWHCLQNCKDTSMVKQRLCKKSSKCSGDIVVRRYGNCYRKMCPETCGFNEFGVNCRGNCKAVCGEDCMDRKEGFCHGAKVDLQLVAVVISLFAIGLAIITYSYIYFRSTQEDMVIMNAISVTGQSNSRGAISGSQSRSIANKSLAQSRSQLRTEASGPLPQRSTNTLPNANSSTADGFGNIDVGNSERSPKPQPSRQVSFNNKVLTSVIKTPRTVPLKGYQSQTRV